MTERAGRQASPPRYSRQPFPAYAYLPGKRPHPRRDPDGHSFGIAAPVAAPWQPSDWARLEHWLFGVDLYNHGYWWESHEQLEALWLAGGRTTAHARFVQAIIWLAAAHVNGALGKRSAAARQAAAAQRVLAKTATEHDGRFMGLDLVALLAELDRPQPTIPPSLRLAKG